MLAQQRREGPGQAGRAEITAVYLEIIVSSAAITFRSTPTSGAVRGGVAQGQGWPGAQPAAPTAVSAVSADAVSTRRRVGPAATEPPAVIAERMQWPGHADPARGPGATARRRGTRRPAADGQPRAEPRIG